jgi:hypothetical protein
MAFKAYDAHKYATNAATWLEANGRAARERRNCYLNIAETGRLVIKSFTSVITVCLD